MSLLELLRINLIGDFFPFACAEFTAVKAPVSMSVPASNKRHCIGFIAIALQEQYQSLQSDTPSEEAAERGRTD
jgi:hypothetical protein